jgi:uncharacterized protein (DUF302 family)
MLQFTSSLKLDQVEAVLRRTIQPLGVHLLSVTPISHLLREHKQELAHDAVVFTICQPELSTPLLAADIRFAAFLPSRIAACSQNGGVTLEAMSPREFCRQLNRPDLDRLAEPLEAALRDLMEKAAGAAAQAPHAAHAEEHSGLGAREDQMNMRGSVPQRIDQKGTKVEDMAGTGAHDSSGG